MKNTKNILASICITSYKRLNELKRCLESIDTKYISKIEIIVSEDHSALRNELSNMVEQFSKMSKYNIIFNSNEVNLGYDRNLAKLISLSQGKYVIFMSDDDCFLEKSLDNILEFLNEHDESFVYTPYLQADGVLKRKYSQSFEILKGEKNACKYIYDAILFSGLIFKRELIQSISAERFVNLNYFQIYLSLFMLQNYGGYYLNIPLVNCLEDGENAYGHTELSKKNELLADRKSIFSNLEFHKGLIKVFKLFDLDFGTNTISRFENEYSLRTYQGLSKAKKSGKDNFNRYWNKLNLLDINLKPVVRVYYFMLSLFNADLCDAFFAAPKNLLFIIRKNSKGR